METLLVKSDIIKISYKHLGKNLRKNAVSGVTEKEILQDENKLERT